MLTLQEPRRISRIRASRKAPNELACAANWEDAPLSTEPDDEDFL